MWKFPANQARLTDAWGRLITIRVHDPADSMKRLDRSLNDLAEMLSKAASDDYWEKGKKGGRPRNTRERGFIDEFQSLIASTFGKESPPLRTGEMKIILDIALKLAGWHHEDIRPLLTSAQKTTQRKKPVVQ